MIYLSCKLLQPEPSLNTAPCSSPIYIFQDEKIKSLSLCYIVLDANLDGVQFHLRIIFDMSK